MNDVITVKYAFNSGDLISSMCGFKKLYEDTKKKIKLYQYIDFPAFYYDGCIHPVKDDKGENVTMNMKQWQMLKPLLEVQDYIYSVEIFKGESVDIDLVETRDRRSITMPYGDLHYWNFFHTPEMQCDLSEKWIEIYGYNYPALIAETKGKIVINRTQRYFNPYINYYFLKKYESELLFAGTQEERDIFCQQYDLNIPLLQVDDFLVLAHVIYNAKFFIGNQSMCWHIADAMKVPRILEHCPQFPNTYPTGANGYAFLYQKGLELYFNNLNK
jgi:hypothetical protein